METAPHTKEHSEISGVAQRRALLTRQLLGRLGKWAFGASLLTMILAGVLFYLGAFPIKTKGELLRWFSHAPFRSICIPLAFLFYLLGLWLYPKTETPKSNGKLPDILLYVPISPQEKMRALAIVFYGILGVFLLYLIPIEIVSELFAIAGIGLEK